MTLSSLSVLVSRISCTLSFIGSLLVIVTCNFPKRVRMKKGRQLIFWLSICDLFTSLVYFLNSFDHGNDHLCTVYALLGIFFPVASFLWTDFIAYYLYYTIVYRQFKNDQQWRNFMIILHVICWGVSGLCILLVGLYGHAGQDTDDGASTNTGGWCWIKASSSSSLFLFELIGGKFVEWVSCVIILPVFYYRAGYNLIMLNRQYPNNDVEVKTMNKYTTRSQVTGMESTLNEPLNLHGASFDTTSNFSTVYYSGGRAVPITASSASSNFAGYGIDTAIRNTDVDSIHEDSDDNDNDFDVYDEQRTSAINDSPLHTQTRDTASTNENGQGTISTSLPTNNGFTRFRHYYIKMGIVPLVFFFIRFWGSLNVILQYATHNTENTWLRFMQGIFDPSQGFFNCIIFVLSSPEEIKKLRETLSSWYTVVEKKTNASST